PDQPLVGRNNKRLTIATIFGDSPFYQARLQFSLAIAAYYEFLKLEGLSSEAESWLRQRIDFKRYFVFKSEEDINTEISLAVQLNLIRRYWDNLLSDIRKAFYSSRDYSGLASKTQYLLTELEGTPNPIFNRSSLVARILTNIKSAVTFHFVHTFRMTPEDVSQFVSSEAFTNLANDHLTKATESGNFEPFYRQVWTFWHEQRQKFLENKREELSKEFKFAQEQKHAIDSLDTLQKKYYNLITTWFSDPSSKDLVNTGINVLDRAITLLGLELTEVALSHPDITPEHRSEFRNEIITVFSKEMSFLLQKLSPKVDSDTASDVPGVPEGSSPQQGM
ncbi:MAG TPA: hypothetical protein VJ044_01160, partial [Candidatus Hodarchaeales archaeon]|nr:hypothetical protein [Candidatus Hodarchaeales archaeon]